MNIGGSWLVSQMPTRGTWLQPVVGIEAQVLSCGRLLRPGTAPFSAHPPTISDTVSPVDSQVPIDEFYN